LVFIARKITHLFPIESPIFFFFECSERASGHVQKLLLEKSEAAILFSSEKNTFAGAIRSTKSNNFANYIVTI